MKMKTCPDFSWSPVPSASATIRKMPPHQPHRMRRDHAHTPCALHHRVDKVAYGEFDDFTREANASGT